MNIPALYWGHCKKVKDKTLVTYITQEGQFLEYSLRPLI